MSPEAKFQPRVVASFSVHQLKLVEDWFGPLAVASAQARRFESAFHAVNNYSID